MKFKDIPIRQKLTGIILLTCSVVLVLMCSAYIIFEYINFKKTIKGNLETLGVIIASNSSAALAFDSPGDATEILSALSANKHIIAAGLFDSKGQLFAKYPAKLPDSQLPSKPEANGYNFKNANLEGFQPVIQQNLHLGTLYLKSDLEEMYIQMSITAFITLLLIAGTLFIAYLLSNYLRKTISKPILVLKRTAEVISKENDFSVRAVKSGNDEIGSLTDAFNQMLNQIERQSLEIRIANEINSKLAAIVESSADAIIGNSLNLIITSWNNSAERIFGYSAHEMMGQSVTKIIPPNMRDMIFEGFEQLKSDQQVEPFETQLITREGKLLDISLTISPVKNSNGEIVGISQIARDISVQKHNERLIIENEEHLRLATQAAELGTFDYDLVRNILIWDKRCRELFGIYHDEPISYSDSFLNGLHEDDRERIAKTIETAFNKSVNGGHYDVEYRTVSNDKKLRWIRAKGKVFFNEEDKPIRFIGTVLDITNKKHEEIRKNDFIAIISHELKTPLTTIKSYVQILLARAKKSGDEFTVNALTRTDTQANKMTSMIKDFLHLARMEEGKIQMKEQVFLLQPLLEDIVSEARLLTSSHVIELKGCSDVKIKADQDKIGQVLINLISNAIKYSLSADIITVGCERIEDKIKIYVKDQGVGISENDQKNLFTRFYRVENEKVKTVSGFGIGLYIVSEILKYHNSQIMLDSVEGKGSTFYFSMDVVKE